TTIIPTNLLVVDLNGDQRLDVAAINHRGALEVLLRKADSAVTPASPQLFTIASGSPIALGSGTNLNKFAAPLDFNNDGKRDLVVTSTNGVEFLQGNGTGAFTVLTPVGAQDTRAILTGDLNGDGRTDIAVAGRYVGGTVTGVAIMLNDGAGGYTVKLVQTTELAIDMVMRDFDNDGILDLGTLNFTNAESQVHILRSNGDGTFSILGPYAASQPSGWSYAFNAGDFNRDGKLDFVGGDYWNGTLHLWLNTCTPNTLPTITAATALTRQPGVNATQSPIATVSDAEFAAGTLTVSAANLPAGISLTNIVNTNGAITANVAAACNAAVGANNVVLQVADGGGLTATATLIVNVTANTPPTLSYAATHSVNSSATLTITPAQAPADNGAVAGVVVQSAGTFTGTIAVNAAGVISLANAAPVGTHTITIRATDNCGATKDASFTLNVCAPPALTAQPQAATANAGSTATFSVTATGTGLSYQWRQNGVNLTNGGRVSGASSATLAISATQAADAGTYSVVVNGTCGSLTSANAALTINTAPTITAALPISLTQGGASVLATLATVSDAQTAAGSLTITLGTLPAGITVTGLTNTNGTIRAQVAASCTAAAIAHNLSLTVTDAGGLTATASVLLSVAANNPPSLAYVLGHNVTLGGSLNITPSFTPNDDTSTPVLTVNSAGTYTGGVTVNAAGLVSLTNAAPAGTHTVKIRATDNCGATTDVSLIINVCAPPAITAQPQAATVAGGSPATFSVTATGSNLTYQWRKNGGNLNGATLATLTINNAQLLDAGIYSVVVSNSCGTVTSDNAQLTVNSPPTITLAQPVTRQQGSAATISGIAMVRDNETSASSLIVTATTIPTGLRVTTITNSNGTISAQISADCAATVGANTIVWQVSDGSLTATANLTVNVTANTPPALQYAPTYSVATGAALTITPQPLASDNGNVMTAFVASKGAFTGVATVTVTGEVSLTNAAPTGTHTITIRLTDNCGATTDASFPLTVTCPTLSLTPTTLANGRVGQAYSQTFGASGGLDPYSYAVQAGSTLPNGLSLTTAGLLGGMPTASGDFNFVVTATDRFGCKVNQPLALTIVANNQPPQVTPLAGSLYKSETGKTITLGTVTDDATSAANLIVRQIAGGTATGLTLTNLRINA
ncbi:MAG: hypothetical protein HOP19_26585, partial [Acidobacteria bacterium]|nr:hypothetical protein [Acidobacteriota bacterium]